MDVADSPGTAPPLETGASDQDSADERERLAAVRRYDILDTPPDGAFDRVTALAARLFRTPMATVSFVDAERVWVKAGYGMRPNQSMTRSPGLCATAICRDDVRVIPDTLNDPVARDNPLVAGDMGFRFYAGAPLVTSDGFRLGTICVMDTRPREASEEQVATLKDLAAIVMDELELRRSALRTLRTERELRTQLEREKAELEGFAATLRRTFQPPALPRIPGLELASHYQPASAREVGGDFYDVFTLGDRRWAFFLGDVCGKDAGAAAVTSLIRHTLRAAALHDPDPIRVLQELNTALLLDTLHEDRFCTVVYGTVAPAADGPGYDVVIGSGGHPPTFVVRAGDGEQPGSTEPVTCTGMLVGALEEATFTQSTVRLGPGDGMLLYTDGLTDAQSDTKNLLGHEGLVAYLDQMLADAGRNGDPISARRLTRGLEALLDGVVGSDDIAILAMSATRDQG
jgi:phosphoserine phosphatase RsbU/P